MYNILVILMFAGVVLAPMFFFHMGGGEIDKTENRVLADYPDFDSGAEKWLNGELESEIDNWVNDHVGMRKTSRKIYSRTMDKLNLTTTSKVVIGQDGWLYFTGNDNILIPKGQYVFTEEDKENIASIQKDINNSYKAQGIDYILVLTPSKVTIYPEYLPFEVTEQQSPSDTVQEELKGTGVKCINVTDALKAQKDKIIFCKTDSHWNQKGSYYAYRDIIEKQPKLGQPVNVEFDQISRTGDLNQMRGLIYKDYEETVPDAKYDWNSHLLKTQEIDSELIEKVNRVHKDEGSAYVEPAVYVNDSVKEGTLLIYGDSMTGAYLNLPRYLAEHYHMVVGLRIMPSNQEVEKLIKPDQVIVQVTERITRSKLQEMSVH